jgi:hypothetical protein
MSKVILFILKKGHILLPYHFLNYAVYPCDTDNGGCDQTCTNNNGVATCSCTTGTINSGGLNCDPGSLYQLFLY